MRTAELSPPPSPPQHDIGGGGSSMDLSVETKSSSSQLLLLLLQQCGDVEPNPGPPRVPRAGRGEPKPDKNAIMQEKVETHDGKIAELEKLAEEQRKTIEEMRAKQVDLEKSLEEAKVDSERRAEAAKVESEEALRAAKVESDRAAAEAKVEAEKRAERIEVEAARGIEAARVESRALVDRAKREHSEDNRRLREEIERLRERMSVGVDDLEGRSEGTDIRVKELETEVDEILERLHEIDKSWQNNLVFYGLKSDGYEEPQEVTEHKIRELIARKMQISREIPLIRVKRSFNGPEVRGQRPVVVCFEKWSDKDEIMRKSKLLKGTNVYVGEDFSKRVKEHRAELTKFMKSYRQRHPSAKLTLQYDKLYADKDCFMFNELTGRVELVNDSISSGGGGGGGGGGYGGDYGAVNPQLIRKKSSGRRRLQKSQSQEAQLHQMTDGLVYPDSPTKSPSRYHQGGGGGAFDYTAHSPTRPSIRHQRDRDRDRDQHYAANNHSNSSSGASSPTKMMMSSGGNLPLPPSENGRPQQTLTPDGSSGRGGGEDDHGEGEGRGGGGTGNGNGNEGGGGGGEDESDDGGVGPMSPMRRVNAIIPETIPE